MLRVWGSSVQSIRCWDFGFGIQGLGKAMGYIGFRVCVGFRVGRVVAGEVYKPMVWDGPGVSDF